MTTSTETASTRSAVTTQVHRIYIKATPEAIWEAIISPEWTARYGYAARSEYELRPGGRFRALANEGMRAMGAPEVAVDGEVIEVDPPRRLVQTWRMVMDDETAAEGFTRLTYEVDGGKGGGTRLTITHELEGAPRLAVIVGGGLEDAPGGEGAGGGWAWVLSDLKSLLETGATLDPNRGKPQG